MVAGQYSNTPLPDSHFNRHRFVSEKGKSRAAEQIVTVFAK
jgi:hypothetical protein